MSVLSLELSDTVFYALFDLFINRSAIVFCYMSDFCEKYSVYSY